MKFHLSIDDVIYSLMDICKEKPDSIFENHFFGFLKNMNSKYGALFTLYAFENYAETFFINEVPEKYWQELCECHFIKIGFHGVFLRESNCLFAQKCNNFYSVIPMDLWASTVRLHRYEAGAEMIEKLHKYGMTTMLCREDESGKKQFFPPSYGFTEPEEEKIGLVPVCVNGINYVKTKIRVEYHNIDDILGKVKKYHESDPSAVLPIFTHEKFVSDFSQVIEKICIYIHENTSAYYSF